MDAILKSEDAAEIHETLAWQFHNPWAVRQGPWKLIHNPRNPVPCDALPAGDQKWFLSNLEQDPGERNNLAAEHPEIVERLTAARPACARGE